MSEQPTGWATASLICLVASDGLFTDGDWVESKDQDPSGDIRLLQLADIGDGVFSDKSARFINDDKFVELRCTELFAGDVLIARMPDPLGRACLMPRLPQRCVTVVDVAALRPGKQSVSPAWLVHTINAPQFREAIAQQASGTTRRRISRGNLAELRVPVPPKPEQQRIADKLDAVLARVDACRHRLARVAPLLKRFRQSVLAAATSGRLTEDWREANPGLAVDAGSLVAARRQVGGSARDVRLLEELIERNPPARGDPSIPPGWLKTCVGVVGVVSNGSTPARDRAEYWDGAIPWVSSGEVRDAEIFQTRECISQAGFDNSSVRLLPVGAVLIAMIGEGKTRGQSALLAVAACVNQNVAGVVVLSSHLEPRYLWRSFQAQYETTRLRGNGTGPQALNCQRVREILVNLPPVAEQREVLRRVETLFAFADRLEARLAQAQTAVDRLTPSLLAKAFRGELVTQDPADEPAAELLKRLAAQRAAAPPKARTTRRSQAA